MRLTSGKGFTLIELLIVIGIVAVLGTITIVIINPIEYLHRARDSQRVADISNIEYALQLATTFASLQHTTIDYDGPYTGGCIGAPDGTPDRLFVSVPASETPPNGGVWEGLTITQAPQTNSPNLDGTGWIPVNFPYAFGSQPTPISHLPIDPINTFENGYYYSYVCAPFALAAKMQSTSFLTVASSDGGTKTTHYEKGTSLALLPATLPEGVGSLADTNPPAVTLAVTTADKLFTLHYPATDAENHTPIIYTVAVSNNQARLDGMTLSQFDNPPGGVNIVSPDISLGTYHIYSLADDHMAIANTANGSVLYFRVRACDSVGNCAITTSVGGAPAHQTISASIGAPEIAYDWNVQKCHQLDLPDNPARFFKNNDGTLTLIASNAPNVYITKSPSFSATALTAPSAHLCSPIALPSTDSQFPYTFDNQEWIFATYKEPFPSTKVHALIHNEYHDPFYAEPPCKINNTTTENPCWYNVFTYAVSNNEGVTFTQATPPQNNLIAAAPDPWDASAITQPYGSGFHFYGYQAPTNIIKKDGYYYTLFIKETDPDKALGVKSGTCLMRTDNLNNPASWRGWNGKQFSLVMDAPYDYPAGTPHASTGSDGCASLSATSLNGFSVRGLTYNTFLQKYITVGEGVVGNQCGFYFAISPDLITWSSPYFLMPAKVHYGPCWDGDYTGLTPYPTFVDQSDTSTNFEFTDQIFDVYYTYWNSNSLDRDLRRNQVILSSP